jgi:putative acyl-CoA dehydrogenase
MLDRYGYATHEVLNQPPPLADYDAYATDPALRRMVTTFGAEWADEKLGAAGATVGSARVQALARQANRHTPELKTHDASGTGSTRSSSTRLGTS